jgi:hypothetical protein
MVITEGILAATLMILGRHAWGYCYSKEEEVVSYVAQMLVLLAVSHFFDGFQSVLSGLWPPFCLKIFKINFLNLQWHCDFEVKKCNFILNHKKKYHLETWFLKNCKNLRF